MHWAKIKVSGKVEFFLSSPFQLLEAADCPVSWPLLPSSHPAVSGQVPPTLPSLRFSLAGPSSTLTGPRDDTALRPQMIGIISPSHGQPDSTLNSSGPRKLA